ncbi:PAS domain S-box protein [Saccharopolyspora shandongensis]|uniref:PAS domain-containing protein n=1 Tax=Saccharopolyspora shandongensis TaxID=418495 RepID=UPI0034469ED1
MHSPREFDYHVRLAGDLMNFALEQSRWDDTAQAQCAAHGPTLPDSPAARAGAPVPTTPDRAGGVERHAVFDQAPVPTAVLDAQGCPQYVNPALCNLLGHGAADLLQPRPHDTLCPGHAVLQNAVVGDTLARGHAVAETWYHKPDGQTIWVRLSGSVINDAVGRPCSVLLQAEDVTTRRSCEILWDQCFATAPIGMALLDLQGHWTSVNDTLCDLLGYRRDEILAMHLTCTPAKRTPETHNTRLHHSMTARRSRPNRGSAINAKIRRADIEINIT